MKKIISTGVLIFLLVAITLPVAAVENEPQNTVRVGFFAFEGYHIQDENGLKSGYGYEILQHIAGYAGLQYEYVGYDKSWSEMQEMLADGQIDILTSAQKTEERMARFDFSEFNIGVSAAILTTQNGNTDFLIDDYENWNGMKVGMIENNSRNKGFATFAAEKGFTYVPVYYDDTDKMVSDLHNGVNIDAILTSNLRSIKDERTLAQFDSAPFYVMVKKGNHELLSSINTALSLMDIYEPGFRTKLMNKYYPVTGSSGISFNAKEKAYVGSMQGTVLRAVLNPDRKPHSYYEEDKLVGSMVDAAKEMIRRSGLNIQLEAPKTRSEYRALIENGQVDIVFDAGDDYDLYEKMGYWLTPAYLEIPVGRLFLKNTKIFNTAALLGNSDIANDFSKKFEEQGITVSYYDSVAEMSEAVYSGKQSMAIFPFVATTLAVRNDVTNRLISEIQYGNEMAFAVAVRETQSPYLYSILKKTVGSFTEDELNQYAQLYETDTEKPFTLKGFLYENPIRFILIIIGLIIVILLVFALFYLAKRRKTAVKVMMEEKRQNEELNEALARAEKADQAKSKFMSRMSHEIRTPLNAVIGYNMLAKNELTEAKTDADRRHAEMKTMDCLAKSEIASKHLLTIINDVLDMSAIDSGKIKIAHERFDFKSLISSLTTVFYSQAKAKGVELEVVLGSLTDEWFVGDQMRINQILTNLISNAIKFTSDGGSVKLIIKQVEASAQETHISFEVSDTGIGMKKDYLDHIWSPFEQADASIARRFGGTGLGLSITKNLVDLMGGKIRVESEPGKGSSFFVDLTFSRMEQPVNADTYDFSKINALIVDDDVSTCDYIKLLFNRFGVHCCSATSGEVAIELFSQAKDKGEPFTVCLVDWRMPKMDGIETIRHIRNIADKDIPIVVITAYDYSEIADKAAEVGINTFISKPLFQSSLFNLLANLSGVPLGHKEKKSKHYSFTGERLILAEDNEMNMEIATRLLSSAGLKLDVAWNGQEAVDLFKAAPAGTYKAILMDVQMPVLDGYQATRVIRELEHPEAKTIPIIALTADAFAENVAEALASGMNDHISKPIDLPTLFETLRKFI